MKGVSGIILAGGKSSRMGRDKSALTINGISFLSHQRNKLVRLGIEDIIISGEEGVPDEHPGCGPLGGIHACLKRAENPCCLVLSVDVPFVPERVLAELIKAHMTKRGVVTLLACAGRAEPLIGVYNSDLAALAEELILAGEGSVAMFAEKAGSSLFEYHGREELIMNCNTPEDYEKVLKIAEETGG